MAKKVRSVALRYGLPLVAFALTLLLSFGLTRLFAFSLDLTTLIIALMIASAWYGGRGPGLLVAILFELTMDYFSTAPFSAKFAFIVINRLALFVSLVLFVSSRRKAETRLRQQSEWLRVTLSSIGEAVIASDINGLVTFINPTAEALTGWSMADAAGKPLADVFKIINETTRQPVESPANKVLREGTTVGLANHTLLVARDGKEIPIDDSGAPIRSPEGRIIGVILVFRDITERRRAEEERNQIEGDYIDFVENASVGMHWAGDDGVILWANKAELDLLGYSHDEYIGRPISEFHADKDVSDEILRKLSDKQTLRDYQARLRHKDGSIKHVLITSNVRWDEGRFVHTRCFTRDITEAKRAEKEREELLAREQAARKEAEQAYNMSAELLLREQAAREQAEEASRMKDEFLATVSHELRTPLNAILGWAGILRRSSVDTDTMAQAVETIERNARAQTQLIEDLLDISRIITGRMRLDVQPVEVPVVIQASVDAIRPAADAKEIRLQVVLDPKACPVSGDPGRLQQVVWNLLSNAVKFTPKGGRVQVRLERINSHIEITVSDTGKGISSEFLPYVFDRFRQADSSFNRVHGGLGLGLAIVRQLVELHGGTVEAQSSGEGFGASFTVKLPITISKNVALYRTGALEQKQQAAMPNSLKYPMSLDGLRLLVVDDDPDACELLVTLMKGYGAEVKAAGSAAEGFEALKQWKPDVLISDIEMPVEDGHSLINKVRALPDEAGGMTPAIALTAHVRTEDRLRVLSSGFDAHVGKPMEPVELVSVIANLARRIGKGRG